MRWGSCYRKMAGGSAGIQAEAQALRVTCSDDGYTQFHFRSVSLSTPGIMCSVVPVFSVLYLNKVY